MDVLHVKISINSESISRTHIVCIMKVKENKILNMY